MITATPWRRLKADHLLARLTSWPRYYLRQAETRQAAYTDDAAIIDAAIFRD